MAIEIVDLPIENGGSFQFAMLNYQRVRWILAILDDFGFGGRFGCFGLSWPLLAYLDSGAQGFLQPPVPQDQASGAASASLAGAQMS